MFESQDKKGDLLLSKAQRLTLRKVHLIDFYYKWSQKFCLQMWLKISYSMGTAFGQPSVMRMARTSDLHPREYNDGARIGHQ